MVSRVAWMAALVLVAGALQAGEEKLGYSDTPQIPGQKWKVHDGERPQPKVITPATASTNEKPGTPPSDAIVLFDGKDLSKWTAGKDKDGNAKPAHWKIEDGAMVVQKGGSLTTQDAFGDMHLHIEWSAPTPAQGTGQGRGNSGVIIMGKYEVQVLDCFENKTYPDGQAGAVYGQYPPLVNAMRPPGEWNVYDILFTAPRFKDGKLEKPAFVTVFHNGVCLHNHVEILGAVAHKNVPKYTPHPEKLPFTLQDHGNPVRYRNIWVREIKNYDEQ